MSESREVEKGFPNRDAALKLLNEAHGGDWGNADFLRWKYEEYPGYDADEHVFYITRDDELVGFRRLFDKEIVAAGRSNCRFFVLGDTAVSLDHRGKGLYSELHAETTSYCRSRDRDLSCTFNREGTITYKANLDRGWEFRTLPLRLRLLSPAAVIPQYAARALESEGTAWSIAGAVGHRVGLSISGERFRLGDLLEAPTPRAARTVFIPLPAAVVPLLVEAVTGDDIVAAAKRHLRSSTRDSDTVIDVDRYQPPFGDRLIDRVADLYATVAAEDELRFRRERDDIEHMFSHPALTDLVVTSRDDAIVGIAPLCLSQVGDCLEAEVLDVVAPDRDAFATLVAEIEAAAVGRGADSIVMLANQDPGTPWIRVDRQVMMWDAYDAETESLRTTPLRVGMYDVV